MFSLENIDVATTFVCNTSRIQGTFMGIKYMMCCQAEIIVAVQEVEESNVLQ